MSGEPAESSHSRPARTRRSRGAAPVGLTAPAIARAPSSATTAMLWGRAAGRCQFEGCNRQVYLVGVTQEVVNVAERAHIRAFAAAGPRASADAGGEQVHNIANLMLLCPEHHVRVDKGDGPQKYPEAMLRGMKVRHEERVRISTGISPGMSSHIVLYGTHVGSHASLPAFDEAARAMFPNRYPAEQHADELGSRTPVYRDRDDEFWTVERKQLRRQFDLRIRERRAHAEVGHLSVFAIAPQPLLIELGTLLGDMTDVDTYQLHRDSRGWAWPPRSSSQEFVVHAPARTDGVPVLVLAVSATITADRITRVLGEGVRPWIVTVPTPHNNVLGAKSMLRDFRLCMRPLLDQIKAQCGHTSTLHVFPALPVALAVELGRVRMPKADMPWLIYDEQQKRGGFVRTFTIAGDTQ